MSDISLAAVGSEALGTANMLSTVEAPTEVDSLIKAIVSKFNLAVAEFTDIGIEFDVEKTSDGRVVARFKYRAYKR